MGLELIERAAVVDLMFMAHHGQVGWYDRAWARLDRLLRDGERRKEAQGGDRRAGATAHKEALRNDEETRRIFEAGKKAHREANAAALEKYVKEQLELQNGKDQGRHTSMDQARCGGKQTKGITVSSNSSEIARIRAFDLTVISDSIEERSKTNELTAIKDRNMDDRQAEYEMCEGKSESRCKYLRDAQQIAKQVQAEPMADSVSLGYQLAVKDDGWECSQVRVNNDRKLGKGADETKDQVDPDDNTNASSYFSLR